MKEIFLEKERGRIIFEISRYGDINELKKAVNATDDEIKLSDEACEILEKRMEERRKLIRNKQLEETKKELWMTFKDGRTVPIKWLAIGAGAFGKGAIPRLAQKMGFKLIFVTRTKDQATFLQQCESYVLHRFKMEEDGTTFKYPSKPKEKIVREFEAIHIDDEKLREFFLDPSVMVVSTSVKTKNIKAIVGEIQAYLPGRSELDPIIVFACENSPEAYKMVASVCRGLGDYVFCLDVVVDCIIPPCKDSGYAKIIEREFNHYFWMERSGYEFFDKLLEKFMTGKGITLINKGSKEIEAYRIWKLWGLNCMHLAVAILGKLLKIEYVHQVLEDRAISRTLGKLIEEQAKAIELWVKKLCEEDSFSEDEERKKRLLEKFSYEKNIEELKKILGRINNPNLKFLNSGETGVTRDLERKLQSGERILTLIEILLQNKEKATTLILTTAIALSLLYPGFGDLENFIKGICRLNEADENQKALLKILVKRVNRILKKERGMWRHIF